MEPLQVATAVPGAGRSGSPEPGGGGVRRGPWFWWESYRRMAHWELAGMRAYLPVIVAVEILAGAGMVLGFGLLMPSVVPPRTALFVSTGVPVINLYLVGMVVMPQEVAQQRTAGTYEFLRSLPIPRAVDLLAWVTVTLVTGLPGMAASLLAAHWRYGFVPHVSPALLASVLLTAVTATAVGSALAHAIPQPMVTMTLAQVLNFVAIGFAPVAFPAERLPGWLVSVNHLLPFESMAVTMRAALTSGPVGGVGQAYLVMAGWTAACVGLALWALGRRG